MIMVERGAINLIMEMVKEGNDDNLLERGVMILSNVSLLEECAPPPRCQAARNRA